MRIEFKLGDTKMSFELNEAQAEMLFNELLRKHYPIKKSYHLGDKFDGNEWELIRKDHLSQLEDQAEMNKLLNEWKRSVIETMPDMQKVGELIGLSIGESVHDKIIPWMIEMKEKHERQAVTIKNFQQKIGELRNIINHL